MEDSNTQAQNNKESANQEVKEVIKETKLASIKKPASPEIISLDDAIDKIKNHSKERKFNESVDIAITLGIDPKQTDQNVKGSVILPNGTGKNIKVIIFSDDPDIIKKSLENGAVAAGLDDLITKIDKENFLDFDYALATPDVMRHIGKIAKKLGPRGLMPTAKNNTVTNDVLNALNEYLKGRSNFKSDKYGIIHSITGKISFDKEKLIENIKILIKEVKSLKPDSSKGKYIKSIYLSSTMGRSFNIDISNL